MLSRINETYETFKNAYLKLSEFAKNDDMSEQHMVAIIHAYEYTFELWWKFLQRYLETLITVEEYGPNATIKNAFNCKVLKEGQIWMDMLRDRNLTTHTYKNDVALEIKERVKNLYLKEFEKFIQQFDNINI